MVLHIFEDALFAAIAAIGFSALSRPPRRAYLWCALTAAVGHSVRFILMWNGIGMHIVGATLFASLVIGILVAFVSPRVSIPSETCLFPALLPMIPGMYAYRCFGGLAMCLISADAGTFDFYFFQFAANGITCAVILLVMVVGATVPVYISKKIMSRGGVSA